MIRILLKLVGALLALALLLIGVLAVALPRLVDTEEFRTALRETAAQAIGAPVEWERVELGLMPPRLMIEAPVLVADGANRGDARLSASSVDLRLAALPILQRRLEVDSLVLHGVELVVTRTPDGFELPIASAPTGAAGREHPSQPGEKPDPGPSDEQAGGFELALRRFVISDSRVIVHDRTRARPIEWHFEDVDLEARGDTLEDPLDVELEMRVAANGRPAGRLRSEGMVGFSGLFDLDLQLEELQLAELQPYIEDATVAGVMSGRVSLEGSPSAISQLDVDLVVAEMAVRTLGLDLSGGLALEAKKAQGAPVDFQAALDLGVGGKADVQGQIGDAGGIEAAITLDALDLEPFASLAGPSLGVKGRATGDARFTTGASGELSELKTNLSIPSARYADGVLDVAGAIDLVLALDGLGETDPIRFDVGMDFASGGRLDADGTATIAGAVDAVLVFDAVELAPIAPLLGEGTLLTGELFGNVDVKARADRTIERLATKLRVSSGHLVSDPVDASGVLELTMGLVGEGPIQLDSAIALSDGSRIRVVGTSTLEGVLDVNAEMEAFDLTIAKPFLPDPQIQIGGRATGTARVVGPVSAPEFVSLDVGFESGLLRGPTYGIEGPFVLTAKLREPLSRPRGRVDLDLSAASLSYSDQFNKKAGVRAVAVTRFVPEESGEIVFESAVALRDLDELLVQGTIGETTSIALTSSAFDLGGWSEMLPVLAAYEPDGRIAFDGTAIELIDGAPSQFGGRLLLQGVGLNVPDAGRVHLRGSIVGEGTSIRARGLKALMNELTVGIEGQVEDPLGEARFEIAVRSIGEAEVNDLLTALTSSPDRVFGPLRLAGDVKGIAFGDRSFFDALEGEIRFSVGENGGGRLRGISLLRTILDQIPLFGEVAQLTRSLRGGRSIDRYLTDRFRIIEGDFVIGKGQLDARKLRLAYDGYEAELSGPIRLRDLSIDMTGDVVLKSDLVSALSGLAGTDLGQREPIRIPLARVTNTLSDPKVVMTGETLAAMPKLLFQATGLDTITLGVGKAIGRILGNGK